MSNDFDFGIPVPDEELVAPVYQPMPTAAYRTSLQAGTEQVSNGKGWHGIRIPFQGFRNAKTGQVFQRALRAQFTVGFDADNGALSDGQRQSVQIGYTALVGAAAALGLTEPTTTKDGKPAQKLLAGSLDELVQQFNQMVGTEVEVFVTAGPRERNGQVVLKDDGTPFVDNEIRGIRAARKDDGVPF